MSSISSAGSSLFQFFKSIDANNSSKSADATSAAADASATQGASPAADGQASHAVHGHHHHHGGGGSGGAQFFKTLQDAVTGALQQAKDSGSSADPNQVVQDAIEKVVKDQGGPQAGGPTSNGQPVQGGDAAQVTGATQSTSSTTSAGDGRQAFLQALQSFGVDPSQFHSDFVAAVHDARGGGSTDASAAFKSFPPGAQVDTTA